MILGNKKRFGSYVKAAIAVAAVFAALTVASAVPAGEAAQSKTSDAAPDRSMASRKHKHEVGLRGHGFVRDTGGNFTTVDVRGATSFTIAFGITTNGATVGGYVDAGGTTHGFLRRGDRVTTIDFPGARGTFAFRANDSGKIVGAYSNDPNVPVLQLPHGFMLDIESGTFTRIDVPGALETRPFGINNAGQIVGEYVDEAGRSHGFVLDTQNGGTFTTIDAPGGTSTWAMDIDDAGRIVGISFGVTTAPGPIRGFLRDAQGVFTPIDAPANPPPPGGTDLPQTQVFGINNLGQMAGLVSDADGPRSFLLDNGVFTMVDAPEATSRTFAFDVSDDGRVAGAIDLIAHGYVRDHGGRFTTIDHPEAVGETLVNGINRRGQLTGIILDATNTARGFLRDKGRFIDIEIPGALGSQAARINDRGQIVGNYSTLTKSNHFFPSRGYVWDRGDVTLIDVPGAQSTTANDIDNQGQIVGVYFDAAGVFHSFLRDPSGNFTTVDIPGAVVTAVTGINERGQMVGEYLDPNGGDHGFVLDNGVVTTIDVPGALFTQALAINDDGVVVGTAIDDAGRIRGFVWKDGTFTPLRAPGAFFWSGPADIDERGRIVGFYL
jgi:probable HAF family extracellular repeat protein